VEVKKRLQDFSGNVWDVIAGRDGAISLELRVLGALFTLGSKAPRRGGPVDDLVCAGVLPSRFAHQAIALLAKAVDLVLHPLQQRLRRRRADARSLQGLNFLALPQNLPAHVLNFIPDVIETRGKPRFALLEQKGNIFASCKLQVDGSSDAQGYPMAYQDRPDQTSAPMNEYQSTTLRRLSIEAYQLRLFADDLTSREAGRRIEELKREIALANSF
jgi:hypothetical protein